MKCAVNTSREPDPRGRPVLAIVKHIAHPLTQHATAVVSPHPPCSSTVLPDGT